MKLIISGYGRMGHLLEEQAKRFGDEVIAIFNRSEDWSIGRDFLNQADVLIDFSEPHYGKLNALNALKAGCSVVSGTTGWIPDIEEIKSITESENVAFLTASNFSVGVNLLFFLNKKLSLLIHDLNLEYQPRIEETHHIHKLDAPSGTAITLAKQIIQNSNFLGWNLNQSPVENNIGITSFRQGEVTGHHLVTYHGSNDLIRIEHEAFNRIGFAQGALLAARYISGKKGVFSIEDVLGLPR